MRSLFKALPSEKKFAPVKQRTAFLRGIMLTSLILLFTACGGGSDSSGSGFPENDEGFEAPTPTNRPLQSAVVIDHPSDGTIIYAETLYITGRVSEVAQQFNIEVVDIDGNVIYTITVDSLPGEWQRELVHGYTGEPSEFILRVVPASPDATFEIYDSSAILLSDVNNRPAGIYGAITQPINGAQIGGDMILVSGRISGAAQVRVEVVTDTGDTLDTAEALMTNPYLLDEVIWQAEITLGNYIGQVTLLAVAINADDEIELGRINLSIGAAAG